MIFARLRDSLAAHLNLGVYMRRLVNIDREVASLALKFGTGASGNKIDTSTLRLPILNKFGDGPVIKPMGDSWMSGAVYDGRPIRFKESNYIYFCGQPSYRNDGAMFIGIAEWIDSKLIVDPAPVIWPDEEERGIDIPTFTVWRGEVIGIYLDDYGLARTGRGYDTSLIVVRSPDGRKFSKTRLKLPFKREWTQISLPWLLADGARLWVYWRGKVGRKISLVRTELAESLDSFIGNIDSTPIPRNAVNVAVTKRNDSYFQFYGGTRAGGLYVTKSTDGVTWTFSKEVMLVGSSGHEWGWDYNKICSSPNNTTDNVVELCYLASNAKGFSIGMASCDAQELSFALSDK